MSPSRTCGLVSLQILIAKLRYWHCGNSAGSAFFLSVFKFSPFIPGTNNAMTVPYIVF